jgi:glycosyltransferase involved in cell wall biosynthesis
MRVAHLDLEPDWRGGENQALLLARALQDKGVSQTLIAYPGGVLWKKAQIASLAVMPLRRFGEWDLLAAYKLRTLLKSLSPDILQVHTAHDASLAAMALRGLSTKLLIMRTVDFPIRDNLFSRWKYRKADRIVAVSQCVAEGLKRQGLNAQKITTIYPCIDLGDVNKVQGLSGLGVSSQTRLVGMFGALTAQKDPLTFVEAAGLCARENPDVHWLIAGEGPLRNPVTEKIRSLGLEKRVSLLGFRPDALRVMAAVDVVVVSSVNEGLNLTILEAGALGIPVVATRAGGAPEAVEDGETGFLVPVGDVSGIARRVNELVKNASLRRKMGEKAKEFVKNFSVERITNQYRELYEEMLHD